MSSERRHGLLDLIRWCILPTRPAELFKILEDIREDELVLAATHIGGAAGRIAWAEYAKRKGYFNFAIEVTSSIGKLNVGFQANAKPVHDLPQYKVS